MRPKFSIVFLILIVIFLSIFVSCQNGNVESSDDFTPDAVIETDLSETNQTETQQIMPDLPDMDYDGKVYKVLGNLELVHTQFTNFEIDAETITGELVNDAVYNRNRRIEEKYNVKIEQELTADPAGLLRKLLAANDDVYSLAFLNIWANPGTMAVSGSFSDLNAMKYLDFNKPWWNKEVNSALSVNNKLYFTISDFGMLDKQRTCILIYSKDIVKAYDMGNLYDLVYENKWTVDKMAELCVLAANDTNGDGLMTDTDQWGLGLDDYESFSSFMISSDNKIITKDNNDSPVLSINNQHTISSIDKILKLTDDKSISYYCNYFEGKVSYDFWYTSSYGMAEGRILFTVSFPHMLQWTVQNGDVDYGVLPLPKYDEKQADYISSIDYRAATVFAVPAIAQDIDFAAFMLEALSAASKYEVMPYYIETSLKTKYTYDEESAKMLDLIFSNLKFDLGYMYNWGDIGRLFNNIIPRAGENNFASQYESIESKVLLEIQKTVDLFNEIN
jgi:hypothetical protein